MNENTKAMTIRIPEGAFELLVERQKEDGVAPAIRVRKWILDNLDWSYYARIQKVKARRTPTKKSQSKPPAEFSSGEIPSDLGEDLDEHIRTVKPDFVQKLGSSQIGKEPTRAERRRKGRGK